MKQKRCQALAEVLYHLKPYFPHYPVIPYIIALFASFTKVCNKIAYDSSEKKNNNHHDL